MYYNYRSTFKVRKYFRTLFRTKVVVLSYLRSNNLLSTNRRYESTFVLSYEGTFVRNKVRKYFRTSGSTRTVLLPVVDYNVHVYVIYVSEYS